MFGDRSGETTTVDRTARGISGALDRHNRAPDVEARRRREQFAADARARREAGMGQPTRSSEAPVLGSESITPSEHVAAMDRMAAQLRQMAIEAALQAKYAARAARASGGIQPIDGLEDTTPADTMPETPTAEAPEAPTAEAPADDVSDPVRDFENEIDARDRFGGIGATDAISARLAQAVESAPQATNAPVAEAPIQADFAPATTDSASEATA